MEAAQRQLRDGYKVVFGRATRFNFEEGDGTQSLTRMRRCLRHRHYLSHVSPVPCRPSTTLARRRRSCAVDSLYTRPDRSTTSASMKSELMPLGGLKQSNTQAPNSRPFLSEGIAPHGTTLDPHSSHFTSSALKIGLRLHTSALQAETD